MTRKQQWAFFTMGIWLTGTIALAFVVTQNVHTIDRLLANSTSAAFKDTLEQLGSEAGRDLLWYLSSELNRLYFQWWNVAQVALALVTLRFLRPLGRGNRAGWFVLGMLAIALFMMFVLTPSMVRIGREVDFLPHEPPPSGLRTVGLLHAAYSVFTLIDVILGVLTIRALRSPSKETAAYLP